jgi:hypothetical protein
MTTPDSISTAVPKNILVVVHDHMTAPESLRSMFSDCRNRFNEVFQHQLDDVNDLWPLMHKFSDTYPEGSFIVFELQLANHGVIRAAQRYTFTELPRITLAHSPLLGPRLND